MVSGRNPDTERLRQIAELRAQGMLLKEIGERFGISKQAVKFALERARREGRSARCSSCRVRIESPVASGLYRDLLCLDCLERHPETPFYRMLKSLRVAAGWTQEELAKQAGLERTQISHLERGRQLPKWPTAVGLLRVLGARLAIRPQEPPRTGRAV
jgi:transcriptional regulator with XRE-family HTH domain